jgi:hypothetical protein
MTANVGTNRKVYVTIEVANAIGNYVQFMDAGAGAYSNEMALKAGRKTNTSTSIGCDRTSVVM